MEKRRQITPPVHDSLNPNNLVNKPEKDNVPPNHSQSRTLSDLGANLVKQRLLANSSYPFPNLPDEADRAPRVFF